MERRELLQWMIATGGVALLDRFAGRDLLAVGASAHVTARVSAGTLTEAQARLVAAAAERIIPRTDTPGATDANVTAFIDTMLTGWYSAGERDAFLAGLVTLDERATTSFHRPFLSCTPAEQDAILTVLDADVVSLRGESVMRANAHWFAMLKYLTVWGYCTSEPGMTQTLRSWPMPMRYDGNAAAR